MIQTIFIHGRQPGISRAELESLFGSDKLVPISPQISGLTDATCVVDFSRIGGSTRMAKILTELPTTDWSEIEKFLAKAVPEHVKKVPKGKFQIGLSVYGLPVSVRQINASALELKKIIKAAGRSVRVVPNKTPELNSAQVLHNQLTAATGWELLLIKNGNKTILAQTLGIQDIEAYAARDQARPHRDAKVGMLPPKLAQIIINLATGLINHPDDEQKCEDPLEVKAMNANFSILDPFCGTGVILQEAALMGYPVIGTDLDPRMVEYSTKNLEWLEKKVHQKFSKILGASDAASNVWPMSFSAIATETYLGRPFSAPPKPEVLNEVMQDVDTIHRKFLQNIAQQTESGFRMCIAVPAWKTKAGFKHLRSLESLEELGYTRLRFAHTKDDELVYHREGQIVARELVVLIRK